MSTGTINRSSGSAATEPGGSRHLIRTLQGMATSDGAGVKLTRIIGQPGLPDLDPFLMLDAFNSDEPDAYIAGFHSTLHSASMQCERASARLAFSWCRRPLSRSVSLSRDCNKTIVHDVPLR